MKIRLNIMLLILLSALAIYAQKLVLDQGSFRPDISSRYLPDTEGKILINGKIEEPWYKGPAFDTITLFPFWPIGKPGQNERGGVWCNLDVDPELEFVYPVGEKVYALNINGTAVTGWPRTLDFQADGAASFGDVDGDGYGEVVVTTHQPGSANIGSVYAFEMNGTDVLGFPVVTEGGPIKTPVLADLDGNGSMEIIVAIRNWPDGFIYIFRGNGTLYPNWPIRMDYTPGSAVAVGDITGDNVPEIIAESYYSIHAWTTDGTLLPGFPYTPGNSRVFSYSSPVLADLDGDGFREIIFGDHSTDLGDGQIYVLKNDGTMMLNWPKTTDYWIYGPPSIGDINGDGTLDIVVGDQVLSATPDDKVYAWNSITGQLLDGFPITGIFAVNSQVILADLDGDELIELMFDDNTSIGKYQGYNHDGSAMEGWPLEVQGSTFFVNPFIVDINGDDIMDISGAGYVLDNETTYIHLWNSHVQMNEDLAILPILQYNTRHNGVYGDYLMVGMNDFNHHSGDMNLSVHIMPNPASTWVEIHFNSTLTGSGSIDLFESTGRMVFSEKIEISNPGMQSVTLNINDLCPGVYYCRLRLKEETGFDRVIISH